jgi:hypothetical protein
MEGGKSMAFERLITNPDPRPISRVPRVATNGTIFSFVMTKAFRAPYKVPTARAQGITIQTGSSTTLRRIPTITPVRYIFEPRDRSIPPVKRTIVIPTARIPRDEDVKRIFWKERRVRNLGAMSPKIIKSNMKRSIDVWFSARLYIFFLSITMLPPA